MTKLKMGINNALTAERFHLIKAAIAEGMGDEAVMAKYEIKTTTLKYIKISENFYEYRLRTEIIPAARKMPKVIAPSSGLEFEDFSIMDKQKKVKKRPTCEDDAKGCIAALVAMFGIMILGLMALSLLVVLWDVQ